MRHPETDWFFDMRARYAKRIRVGIAAARLPHRLRAVWLLQNYSTSALTMAAFWIESERIDRERLRWALKARGIVH